MLRRIRLNSFAVAVAGAARNIAVFTEQSEVLANTAKHRGFNSNVWVEADDAWWTKALSPLKHGEVPVREVPIQRRIELYNVDQLVKRPQDLPKAAAHSSMRTSAPFGGRFQEELETKAKIHGFASKWWLSRAVMRKQELELRRGAAPVVVMITGRADLYNAEQFQEPSAIAATPFSGLSKKPYRAETADALRAFAAEKKFSSGLFFTLKQLEGLGLGDLVAPGAEPLALPVSKNSMSGSLTLYNVESIVKGDALAQEMQRYPVDVDTYLISGRPVGEGVKAQCAAAGYASKYWVSGRDVEMRKLKVRPDAKSVEHAALRDREQPMVKYFNVHQLTDPTYAFRLAGARSL
jgi:hypothetical protein